MSVGRSVKKLKNDHKQVMNDITGLCSVGPQKLNYNTPLSDVSYKELMSNKCCNISVKARCVDELGLSKRNSHFEFITLVAKY